MFISLNSNNRFLIALIRAVKNIKKHLYSAFYQEPTRKPLKLLKLLKSLKPSGLLGLLKKLKQLK